MEINNPNTIAEELEIYEKEIIEKKSEIVKSVVLNALYSLKLPQPIPNCSKKINLKELPNYSEKLIGQIIGRDGKHKHSFMEITGVNIELDQNTSDCVILSKYNPVHIEKAKMLLEHLLKNSNWTHKVMQKKFHEIEKKFKNDCIEDGSKILTSFLKYETFTEELAEVIGLLKYSWSFSQNILDHSYEVAQLAGNIASQIGLDVLSAKRAGFFHDIGKTIANHDDHVMVGKKIAQNANLEDYIVNTIESHHGKIKTNNPYAIIVKAVDKLSAGRIGARPMQNTLIEKRKSLISKELMNIDWVDKVVLKNAGNLIQIFIKLDKFDYSKISEMKATLREILQEKNTQYTYNYQIELKMFYEESFLMQEIKKEEKE